MDWAWGRCHPPRRRHPGRGRVLMSSFSDPAVGGEFSTDFTSALMSLLARLGSGVKPAWYLCDLTGHSPSSGRSQDEVTPLRRHLPDASVGGASGGLRNLCGNSPVNQHLGAWPSVYRQGVSVKRQGRGSDLCSKYLFPVSQAAVGGAYGVTSHCDSSLTRAPGIRGRANTTIPSHLSLTSRGGRRLSQGRDLVVSSPVSQASGGGTSDGHSRVYPLCVTHTSGGGA